MRAAGCVIWATGTIVGVVVFLEWLTGRGSEGQRRVAAGDCEANFSLESLEPRLLLSAVVESEYPYILPDTIAQVSDLGPIAVIQVDSPACESSRDVQFEKSQLSPVMILPYENSPTNPTDDAAEYSSSQDGSVAVSSSDIAYAVEGTGLFVDDGVSELQAPLEYDPSNLPSSTEEIIDSLHAANPPPQSGVILSAQTTDVSADLGPLLEEAIRQWSSLPMAEELQTRLEQVKIEVVDLSGGVLAQTLGETILIDKSAVGYGWFIDPTPSDNEEFAFDAGAGRLLADSTSSASERMDLLTVLVHEIGHVLGLGHESTLAVMTETLSIGQRVLLGDNSLTLLADANPVEAALTAVSGVLTGEADDGNLMFRVFDSDGDTILDVEVTGLNVEDTIYTDVTSVTGLFDDTVSVDMDLAASWNLSGAGSGTVTVTGYSPLNFTSVEHLVGADGEDTFAFPAGVSFGGTIDGGGGSDTLDYSAYTNGVMVSLATGTATGTSGVSNIENVIGGSGNDTLTGNALDNTFTGGPGKDTITGGDGIDTIVETRDANFVLSDKSLTTGGEGKDTLSGIEIARLTAGVGNNNLNATNFSGSAVLDGGPGNDTLLGGSGNDVLIGGAGNDSLTGGAGDDTYVLTPDGTDTIIEAADGGSDTLVYSAYTSPVTINLPEQTATGVTAGFGNIENVIGAANLVISGTASGETIIIQDTGTADDGYSQIQWIEAGGTTYTINFMVPDESLKVEAKEGADTIEVRGLDSLFSADLLLYGYESGAPELMPDPSIDEIRFSGNTLTHGGAVEAFADKIYVDSDVTISTLDSTDGLTGDGGDIVFRARRISTSELTNFLPVDVYLREVEVNIGDNAKLLGAGIYLFAQAEDRDLTTMLGTGSLENEFFIEPLLDMVSGLTAMPVKVLYKESNATITIGQGAQIIGSDTVGLYATAVANAAGEANSIYFSAGYGDARATAVVDIASGALIQSTGGAVVVTSDANATAKIEAETEQGEGEGELAGSIAVTNAVATSTITLASGATVEAYKTANLRAKGDITSEPEAKGSTTENGIAGLAFGIAFSDSDIHTQVDGTIIAHVEGDYLVKLEIDPTAGLNPDGTPQVGYIDYDNDRIYVGNSGLVTEDVVNYDSRRGTPIGGLIDDHDYVIVDLGNGYIQLALTEQNAIDGDAIDLWYSTEPGEQVTMNTKGFGGVYYGDGRENDGDVDNNRSRIRLDNSAWDMSDNSVDWQLLGLTFELGQAVVYHEGSAPIEGLVDGHTYYVITGIDEFDLQGDSRWVQEQWIQLAETEMEARAGVNISFRLDPADASATDFRLEAKHMLDSGFSNGIGILAELKAEDKASAEAGVKPEDNPVFDITDFPGFDSSIFDSIVGALMSNDGASTNAAQAGSNNAGVQGSPVTAAGAFAFSYANHNVTADVGGTAVLKSNEDLEVKAIIDHEVQLSAESETGLPESEDGSTPATGGGEASVSIAVVLGLFTADAEVTVHSGAQLDALRATRLISMVKHPYLTSPDEFFPSTLGEFIDSIKSEGYGALNKYMDGTLGLKSELFNSWARSAAEANDVGIAGSVNVLSFNNTAQSLIEDGVLINQDEDWRDYEQNPHENNQDPDLIDPVTYENIDETANEQVVSIEASNYMELINMTGIFSLELPEGSLNPPEWKLDPKLDINPVAAEGEKGGVGGALFVMLLDNTTHSTVEDGAKIYSGSDGTFNMKADEAIFNIDLGQAGASAGTVSVGGTVMYTDQDSDTVAQLGSGVEVTGREVSIYAASLETNVMWAGGIAKGEAIGAGISVAVNDINRRTLALIGDEENQTPGLKDVVPGINVSEDVTARAIVGGQIWAFTVAGAVVSKSSDQPTDNAPGGTDPLAGASTPQLFDQQPSGNSGSTPTDTSQEQQTGIAIAAAVGVNLIKEYTQASVIDAGSVKAGSLSVTAENRTDIVAITGGLAFTKESSGDTAVALAGAFGYNAIDATTIALVEDTDFDLDGNGIEWPTDIDNPTEVLPTVRISSLAKGKIISAAAGGAGSVAAGGSDSGGGGDSTAIAVAGSVSVNIITSDNSATARNATFAILSTSSPDDSSTGHVNINASNTSSIFAISGGLSLSIASGKQGSSTAVSAGIAVAVNLITSSTIATLEDVTITWVENSKGDLIVSAESAETIDAYTMAGAVSVANGTSGSGIAAAGAASGSVNQIDFNTLAVVKDSEVTLGTGSATILAQDESKINSIAGSIAAAVGFSDSGNGGAGAVGAAFSINNIGSGEDDGSFVWADVDKSNITAGGDISVEASNAAKIFALAIGAAGSVSESGSGNAISGSLAGSASINQIRVNTRALVRKESELKTRTGTGGAVYLGVDDDSSINATAGAADLSISVSQGNAVEMGLGFSLTINDIANTTRAAIEDSDIIADGTVTVSADSEAKIDSLAFGISVGVDVSAGGSVAVGVNATGALSFNKINNLIEATVIDTEEAGTTGISAGGAVSVTASNDSRIDAIATAATATLSVNPSATSVSVAIGLALAHNRIDEDVSASLVNVPSVLTGGNDLIVKASDASEINATTFAAAVSVSVGTSTSVGVAGGASESTNIILSRTNAYIKDSTIGSAGNPVGNVDLEATSTADIDAVIGAVAAAFSFGSTGAGVAVGIAVARNFIGLDPNGIEMTADYTSTTRNEDGTDIPTTVTALTPGMKVCIASGALTNDIYEYIGPEVTDSDPNQEGAQPFDLSIQQYRDATLWKHVNADTKAAQVQAYIEDSSVWADGDLTIDAKGTESINAIVVAAAVGIGGGTGTGVAISAAGCYAENKIKTDIKAYIDGDGPTGIRAGSVALNADDSSAINAISGAASLAAGFGANAGVAVSIGLSLSFNEISNDVEAYISNADDGVITTIGGITISALSQGQNLFDLNLTDIGLTTADLDNAATADANNPDTPENEAVLDANADRAVLEALRTAFAANGETLAMYDIVGTAAKYRSSDGDPDENDGKLDIREGDTVLVEKGYTYGGEEGRVYRYIVVADESDDSENFIDLSTEDYTDTTRWQLVDKLKVSILVEGKSWLLVAPDGKTYVLELNEAGNAISVSRDTINAVSAAASMAVGVGNLGIAVSGAGAAAQNIILTKINAYGLNSVFNSAGDVSVSAASSSKISSTVVAASLAIGGGPTAGVGASFGVSIARNFIGWIPGATIETPAEIQAFLNNTSVEAGGDLSLTALASQTINSIVIAGSAAVGLGGTAGIAISGSGVWVENKIGVDVKSYINDDGDSGIQANSVTLTADDTSNIKTLAGAVSLAASVSGIAAFSFSIGVSLARNTITSNVEAYVLNASIDAGAGGVTISAKEGAAINAVSFAASLGAGFAGIASVSISGAGADANNIILTGTNAYVQDSDINSDGKVDLDAENTANIHAVVVSASASISVGGIAGVGASVGVAVARNYIGWNPNYDYDEMDYLTGDNPDSIVNGNTVKIAAGPNAGNVYEYIGTDDLTRPDGNDNWLIGLDYSNESQWRLANLVKSAALVQAYILDSSVDAAGALTLDAISNQTINATVFAGAVALSGGLVGVSLSGAGASSDNRVATLVQAYIEGDGDERVEAGVISLNAEDTSEIESFTGSASVALAFGAVGGSVSIGIGLAKNEISNDVKAYIKNVETVEATEAGGIEITANENATITSSAIAASAALSGGLVSLSIAGAGADAVNVILNTTQAYVDTTDLVSAGKVDITADDTAEITAHVMSLAAGVAVGGIGVAFSIGVATAHNFIGYNTDGEAQPAEVLAYVQNATVDAGGAVNIIVTEGAKIDAKITSGSVSVAVGAIAVGVSGSGVSIENKVKRDVKAFVNESSLVEADGTVTIKAADESTITATANAVSFAAAIGLGGAGAISLSFANNTVENNIEAYVTNAKIITTGTADLLITANENATVTSEAKASAAAFSAFFSLGIAGATSDATIETTTRAYADTVELNIAGNIKINAIITGKADSTTTGASYTAGLSGVSDVKTDATAIINPFVESYLKGYADERLVKADGDISVVSTLGASANALAEGSSTSVSLGSAKAAPIATALIAPQPEGEAIATVSSSILGGNIVSTNGDITVKAIYNQDMSDEGTFDILGTGAEATAHSSSGSFAAESSTNAIAVETPYLDSWVASDATLNAGDTVKVIARSLATPAATAIGKSGGFVGIGESHATAIGSPIVDAHMDGQVKNGEAAGAVNLIIQAVSSEMAASTSQAVSGGLAANSKNTSTTTVSPTVDAYIGDNCIVNVSGSITVEANDSPDADATTKGVAKGFAALGASESIVVVTPSVTAYFGTGSQVKAGSVDVSAIAIPSTPEQNNVPSYNITAASDEGDTLTISVHGLETGDVIEYWCTGDPIGGLVKPETETDEDGTVTTARQYSVLYVDPNTIALGAQATGVDIDPNHETITFSTPHNFIERDTVVYKPSGSSEIIGGLTADTTYIVHVVDANTIQLMASDVYLDQFNVGSVGIDGKTINDSNSFTDGDAVTYAAPSVGTFGGSVVDVHYDTDDDGNPVFTDDTDANNIYFLDAEGNLVNLNFTTGDYAVYSVEGGEAISGLSNGQTYRVLKINDYSIRLAPTVTANLTFDTSTNSMTGVNWADYGFMANQSITISGSSINNGNYTIDSISGDTLYVTSNFSDAGTSLATVDGNTAIELMRDAVTADLTFTKAAGGTNAYISGVNWSDRGFKVGDSIMISGSSFEDGDTTTSNDGIYTISIISGNTLYVNGDFNAAGSSSATAARNTSAQHGLTRQAIGGLEDGKTYYVFNRTDSSYQLAASKDSTTPINLDTTGLSSVTLHSVGPQYIDLDAPEAGSTHQFRIDITSSSLPSGTHWITGQGGVSLAETLISLGDGISTADSTGSGKGFVGDTPNTAKVTFSPIVKAYIASASLTTTASPTATGNISVLAQSETNARANTTNGTAGFVGIGRSNATTIQESITYAYIVAGTNIVSGGNVTIDAKSNDITSGSANAKAKAGVGDVRAKMTSTLSYDTQAYLESEAKIAAAGYVGITSEANSEADTHSFADGRGFGAGGYAETKFDIVDSQSLVTLGENAVVIADTAALRAITTNMNIQADAKGYGAGFVGVSDNFAKINIEAENKVELASGSSLTGYRGVDLEATFNNVDTYAYSYGRVTGVFGWVDSDGNNTTALTSSVVTNSGAQVTAGPRDNSFDYSIDSLPTELNPGDRLQMPDGTIYIYLGPIVPAPTDFVSLTLLLIQIYNTPSLWEKDFLNHPTGDADPLDQLALYVNTTNENISIDADAKVKKRALAAGHADTDVHNDQTRTINWNADVHIISSGQGAELIISHTGEIVKADGVSVNDGQTSGSIDGTEISVDDIANSGTGQVYFNNAWVDGDEVGISGAGSTWNFSDTIGQVLITNYWDRPLKINDINVVNTNDNPLVDLNSTIVTLTFDIGHAASPSLVQILNEADSDIILNGTINNPIGSTVIHNAGGDIIAARERDAEEDGTGRISLVRTAVLDIRATSSIGLGPELDSDSPRVNVDIIYPGLPTMTFRANGVCGAADALFLSSCPLFTGQLVLYETDGTPIEGLTSGEYYTVIRSDDGIIQLATPGGDVVTLNPSDLDNTTVHTLTAAQHVVGVAGGDIYLDLKAVFRDESLTEFTATIDSLKADGTIDVLLQDAEQETGVNDTYAGVRVTALQDSTPPPPYDDHLYHTHFWDDGAPQAKDLAVFGGGTKTPVDCVYDFRDINTATGDRTVASLIAGTTDGNIIINDADGTITSPTIAVLGLTNLLGTGHIDVNVNNWIDLTEVTGDLRVGLIQSRGSDVTLTASDARIVDALNDLTSDVIGVNITLTAPRGIGTFMNRLEFSWSNPTIGLSHLLEATIDGVTWYTFTYDGTTGAILDAGVIHLRYIGAP